MTLALPILDTDLLRPSYARGPRDLASVRLLRISITDRCNLRCIYCMPDDGTPYFHKDDLLSADDVVAVAKTARSIGVDHFKITGGEPTVHGQLIPIVRRLAALHPRDLSLTTNGLRLEELAKPLREAGLDRLTVSMDSLDPTCFNRITRSRYGPDTLKLVWRGLEAAQRAGFTKIKLNIVVIGGLNDHEVADFAMLTLEYPWTVRFIEYMPLGDASMVDNTEHGEVDNAEVRRRIEDKLGALQPVVRQSEVGVGPANLFALAGSKGRIGFISAMSQPFCENCNRLRLTAAGELRSCLFDGGEVSVLSALRPKPNIPRLIEMMGACVQMKPETHSHRGNRAMSQLGG